MKLSARRVRSLARQRGLTLTAALKRAGVSRTAYYSLVRRPSVVPRSVRALAAALGVAPAAILDEERDELVAARLSKARAICEASPGLSFDTVWHTLVLLELSPVERLNRSLIRGRAASLHR